MLLAKAYTKMCNAIGHFAKSCSKIDDNMHVMHALMTYFVVCIT